MRPACIPCSTPRCGRLARVNATCDGCDRPICGWCDRVGDGRCYACRARAGSMPESRTSPQDEPIPATAEPSAPVACGRDRRQA
jgi:hypothetical protein